MCRVRFVDDFFLGPALEAAATAAAVAAESAASGGSNRPCTSHLYLMNSGDYIYSHSYIIPSVIHKPSPISRCLHRVGFGRLSKNS